jgi:NAD(P)-dependent dehydrogenase (short-subunit alcohol dehydrogenase family)
MTDRDPAPVPTAVVTGAGTGLGRQSALALAAAGFRVALLGRTAATLEETAGLLVPPANPPLALPTDVSDPAAVDDAFARVMAQWGRVDVLVNNAGIAGPSGPLEDVTPAQWDEVLAVNVTGSFRCAQHAVHIMKTQRPKGGRIINIGSVAAQRPRPDSVAYAVSKHAMTGLTASIGLEGRSHRISCTQIDIGNAASSMTESIAAGIGQADGTSAAEPTFDPVHVGELVAHLAALPVTVSVPQTTILATGMPFLGRG